MLRECIAVSTSHMLIHHCRLLPHPLCGAWPCTTPSAHCPSEFRALVPYTGTSGDARADSMIVIQMSHLQEAQDPLRWREAYLLDVRKEWPSMPRIPRPSREGQTRLGRYPRQGRNSRGASWGRRRPGRGPDGRGRRERRRRPPSESAR